MSVETIIFPKLKTHCISHFGRVGICIGWVAGVDRDFPARIAVVVVLGNSLESFSGEIDFPAIAFEIPDGKYSKWLAFDIGKWINPKHLTHCLICVKGLHLLHSLIVGGMTTHLLPTGADYTVLLAIHLD